MRKLKYILLSAGLSTSVSYGADTLIVGDSHVAGAFGESLHKEMIQQTKSSVRTIGLAGASASTFVSANPKQRTLSFGYADRKNENEIIKKPGEAVTAPELKNLLTENKPQRIIIELGDIFADYKNPGKNSDVLAVQQVKAILNVLQNEKSEAKCYWITPTWTDKPKTSPYQKSNQRLAEIIQIIKKTAEPRCKVIDSTNDLGLTQNNIQTTNDGLHFNTANGQKWAKAAAKKINELEGSSPEQKKKGITNSLNKNSPAGIQ